MKTLIDRKMLRCRRCEGGRMQLERDEEFAWVIKCLNCGYMISLKPPKRIKLTHRNQNMEYGPEPEIWRKSPSLSSVLRPQAKYGWKRPNPMGQPGIKELT